MTAALGKTGALLTFDAPRRRAVRRSAEVDRGSVTLELVVLAPGLLLFIGLVVFAGRTSLANQSIAQAANEAARIASIARTQPEADRTAGEAARSTLVQQDLQCLTTSVSVDTTGFGQPVGTAATITATVSCVVRLSDLAVPGLPGSRTVTATATSPLDVYRER